ncbi:glycosyltransferase [Ponticaulis profundi]|uniref:Glycosyltransferase n=1 Tax=Ponticaulis profundi TaxID=2665222 RepID=A0ABW1SDG2_9PROT
MILIKRAVYEALLTLARWRHQSLSRGREKKYWPEGFVVSGFFRDEFGLARSAELTATKLEMLGFKVIRHNIRNVMNTRPYFAKSIDAPEDYGWIIHANPPEVLAFLLSVDPRKTPRGMWLSYWAWELDVFPKGWSSMSDMFDDVLVPSKFVQDSLATKGVQTSLLTHPVSLGRTVRRVDERDVKKARTFFIQMDGNSSFSRKNILTALEAFRIAFRDSSEFELILKTRNLKECHEVKIREQLAGMSNVRWLNWTLGESNYQELWNKVDCVVSTHRSEGFGLGLAESAWLNRPIIGTGWSGNMDYMCDAGQGSLPHKLIPVKSTDDVYGKYASSGAEWADVEVEDVVSAMMNVADNGYGGQPEAIRQRLSQLETAWDEHMQPGSIFRGNYRI